MSLTIEIVTYPETQLAGINIKTNMNKAQQDCPAIWQRFGFNYGARLMDYPAVEKNSGTYGLSYMLDEENFFYWAAVPVNATEPLPEEFELITVAGGQYAKITVPDLERLGEAYTELYQHCPEAVPGYQFDAANPISFELYPTGWSIEQQPELYIFAPIVKK